MKLNGVFSNFQTNQKYFKLMLCFTRRTLRFIEKKCKFSINITKSLQNKPPKILPTACISGKSRNTIS